MRSMLRRLLRRHSTAVAYLALFAALGGSAYAAVTVTGKNIKDGTVTGRDIKNGSLKGLDVKDESLKGADVAEATLGKVPSAAQADSAQNAHRAQSAESATNAQNATTAVTANAVGPDAVTGQGVRNESLTGADIDEATLGAPTAGFEFVSATSANNSDSPKEVAAECPAGKRYIFGGFHVTGGKSGTAPNGLTDVVVDSFLPNGDYRRVFARAYEEEPHAGNWQLYVSAVCINAP